MSLNEQQEISNIAFLCSYKIWLYQMIKCRFASSIATRQQDETPSKIMNKALVSIDKPKDPTTKLETLL